MSAQATKQGRIQLRKGDQVKVISGRDAGKSGRVLSSTHRRIRCHRARQHHQAPHEAESEQERQGGIVEKKAR